MKKKLFRVLLVLSLCTALAIPAFAEPVEEPTMPEETTPLEVVAPEESEVLTGEEVQNVPDPAMENGESEWIIGHLHCVEEYEIEESLDETEGEEMGVTKWQAGYLCSDPSCPYLQNSQTIDIFSVASNEVPVNCSRCGAYNWALTQNKTTYGDIENPTTHTEYLYREYRCQTTGCTGWAASQSPGTKVAHSWKKGSLVGYQSSSAVAHKAVYNYSCKCGASKTDGDLESHSLKEIGYTGNNYHQGTKHYFEYQYQCSQCGYTKTQYKSYSCPGPTGGGCIMPDTPINRVDPPVEVQDVTGPEEAA